MGPDHSAASASSILSSLLRSILVSLERALLVLSMMLVQQLLHFRFASSSIFSSYVKCWLHRQSFSSFLFRIESFGKVSWPFVFGSHLAEFLKLLFRSHLANFSNFCSGLSFAKFLELFMFRTHLAKFLSSFCSGLILLTFLSFWFKTHLAKFLKFFVFKIHLAKFLKLFVQNWFGKVLQALCSQLIWQNSSSFLFKTDLAKFFKLFVHDWFVKC